MIHKKLPYDRVLAIALMLSTLRIDNLDWTDYFREDVHVTNSRFHDTILGPSVGLTETQFHNLYNSVGQTHSKNIIRDSIYYDHSAFRELDSLYEGLPALNGPRTRVEVTTFLLDTQESSAHRSNHGQVLVAQPPTNPSVTHNHVNINSGSGNVDPPPHHESDSDEGFEEMETDVQGAVGESHSVSPTPSDELSIEDMDLIESLWRQDIDMGVCPDTYPYKADINKPGFAEELKKQEIDLWDYSIDGETGEYVSSPQPELEEQRQVQRAVPPQIPHPQPQPQPDTQLPPPQEGSLSLEDCLQLLEDEYSPDNAPTELLPGQGLTQQEAEQRWQDLATIPELQGSIPELLPNATMNTTQDGFVAPPQQHYLLSAPNATRGLSSEVGELPQPQMLNDVFAVNASTNGMVSLQNATQPLQQPPLLMPPAHNNNNNDSYNGFTNLNLEAPNHSANATVPSADNMTDYLMQTLQQQMSTGNASAAYSAANLNGTDNNSSLLMELLNSPGSAHAVNPLDLDFDEQMHDVIQALGDDAEALSDNDDSDDSTFDETEGAAGYSSSDQDSFKGATGGYGFSRGHERQYGSDSSGNSYSGQPPKMENIKHNHSYAAPSQSQMQNGNGASNSSYNGTNGNAFKLNRDEKRAKALKLPIGLEKIINLPVDTFNDMVKKFELNDAQMQLVRDIRRRGKNKVAAQNCRKRKIDAITMVESTVGELRMERDKLVKERDSIDKEVSEMQQRYSELCEEVFSSIQDEHGGPVNPNDYTLQQMPNGTVFLVPRNGNSTSHRDRDEQSM